MGPVCCQGRTAKEGMNLIQRDDPVESDRLSREGGGLKRSSDVDGQLQAN